MKPLASLLLGASVLLVGCSSTYGSREEASGAADEWVADSRLVVVEWKPSYSAVQSAIQEAYKRGDEMIEEECYEAQREHQRAETSDDLRKAQVVINNVCRRKYIIDEEGVASGMVRRETKRTRWCDEEKETKQFVCKERDVDEIIPATESTPMSGNEWDEVETTYSYFRY